MKIAIMGDSHDEWDNLEKAVKIANDKKCDYLLFAGDLIAPPGIVILERFKGSVAFVWGNNEGEKVGMTRKFDSSKNVKLHGDIYEEKIDGVGIFMNHYPRITELVAKSGEFDVCIYGHTHEYHEEKIDKCLLVNPGEIQGYATGNSTFMIFDTVSKEIEKVEVE